MANIIERGSEKHKLHEHLVKTGQADYEAGFQLGVNRKPLEKNASEQKRAGYMNGFSTGKGATATSPMKAFNAPPVPAEKQTAVVEEKKPAAPVVVPARKSTETE